MTLHSRYIKLHEFSAMAKQIPGTELLIPVMGTLCLKGLARGSFFKEVCFSMQGVYPLTDIIGDAWMISHPTLLKKYPLTAHKSAMTVIKDSFDFFPFEAIQIQVPDDFHVKWCESMGFIRSSKINDKVLLYIHRKLK